MAKPTHFGKKKFRRAHTRSTAVSPWGMAPTPLLPSLLRKYLTTRKLPRKLLAETGLPEGTCYSDLGPSIWEKKPKITEYVFKRLATFLFENFDVCSDQPLIQGNSQLLPDYDSLPISKKSVQLLTIYYPEKEDIEFGVCGDLFELEGYGARTALEILCILEAVESASPNFVENEAQSHTTPEQLLQAVTWADGRFVPDIAHAVYNGFHTSINQAKSGFSETIEIEKVAGQLIINRDLSQEIADYLIALHKGPTERTVDIINRRYGWSGKPPETLQEIGGDYGLTRERVRQIQSKFEKHYFPEHPPFLPALTLALAALTEAAPLSVNQANDLLLTRGLSSRPVDFDGVLSLATVFKHFSMVEKVAFTGADILVPLGSKSVIPKIERYITRMRSKLGFIDKEKMANIIKSAGFTGDAGETFLNRLIACSPVLSPSRSHPDKLILSNVMNKSYLHGFLRKTFSVCHTLPIDSVLKALLRAVSARRIRLSSGDDSTVIATPDRTLLSEILTQVEGFEVFNGQVVCQVDYDPNVELAEPELAFLLAFEYYDTSVLTRGQLLTFSHEVGIDPNTANCYTSWTPILDSNNEALWSLRGRTVLDDDMDKARQCHQEEKSESRLIAHKRNADGSVCLVRTISTAMLTGGLVNFPNTYTTAIADRYYTLFDSCGNTGIRLKSNKGVSSAQSVLKYLHSRQAEVGMILVIEFNPLSLIAQIELFEEGDTPILETCFPGGNMSDPDYRAQPGSQASIFLDSTFQDGRLTMSFSVSHNLLTARTRSVNKRCRYIIEEHFASTRYPFIGSRVDRVRVMTISETGKFFWGYNDHLQECGVKIGDTIDLVLDQNSEQAELWRDGALLTFSGRK